MGVLILANLEAEHRLAGETLTRAALETASALGTLLRVFAGSDADRLWTPVPVDPARVPGVPGLPRPELISGPWEDLQPADEVLAWAEVPGVETLRNPPTRGAREGHGVRPEVVRRVLHRKFGFRLARDLGVALPGARWLRSPEELWEHLEAGGAAASPTGGWVLKAPLSAAGRSRRIVAKAPRPDEEARLRARTENLFARHGELLFEPWMDRVADFGCTGYVGEAPTRLERFHLLQGHRLEVDAVGRFTGIELGSEVPSEILEIAREVARALAAEGYRGPFGIDAYLHRDREGRETLQPLGEINARLTFGHVARALLARALATRVPGPPGAHPVRLRVGRQVPEISERAIPLLLPRDGEAGSVGAWWLGPALGPVGPAP